MYLNPGKTAYRCDTCRNTFLTAKGVHEARGKQTCPDCHAAATAPPPPKPVKPAKVKRDGPGRPPFPDGEAADSHLHIRVDRRRKARYVRAAQKSGLGKLAPWVIVTLDEASEE